MARAIRDNVLDELRPVIGHIVAERVVERVEEQQDIADNVRRQEMDQLRKTIVGEVLNAIRAMPAPIVGAPNMQPLADEFRAGSAEHTEAIRQLTASTNRQTEVLLSLARLAAKPAAPVPQPAQLSTPTPAAPKPKNFIVIRDSEGLITNIVQE
jgi:hypothetical protein